MEEAGITFKCNAEVGANISINDLLREFHAVVLAGGSTIPRDLPVPGRHLKGIHFAMDFLKQQHKRVSHLPIRNTPPLPTCTQSSAPVENIWATNKNVVVIGGGDTGSDCVGTSNRHKAMSVTQFELMPKPPHARNEYMPWPTYPMRSLKTSSSHEEGADRHWAIATKEFIGDEQGNLKALKTIRLEWAAAADGKPAHFTEVPGSETELPCELGPALAMGFVHPQQCQGLLKELDIELDDRGNVKATDKTYQTNIAKVFTAGDMRRGQSLVVWAISEGRECARKVDEYLIGAPASLLERRDQSLIAL